MTDPLDLTPQEIDQLKASYGPVFRLPIEGVFHYFRTLTRNEAVEIGLTDGFMGPDQEEDIFAAALVYPTTIESDDLPAGVPKEVATQVLERSGLAGHAWLNTYADRSRNNQTAYHTIAATICCAYSTILPAELDDLNIETLMQLLVQAEEVLSIRARIARGEYVALSFEAIPEEGETAPQKAEPSKAQKDEAMRAMLDGSMVNMPAGWIDSTPKNRYTDSAPDPREGI